MNILALDLSLTSTGVAAWDGEHRMAYRFRPAGKGTRRLESFHNWMDTITGKHRPDVVAIEGYSFGSRGRAVFSIGEMGGVVKLYLRRAGIPWFEIPPSNVKKYATGKGNASKEDVLAEAIRRLEYQGSSTDEADALWMLEMTRAHYGEPCADVPKSHRKAMDKIKWAEVAS